MTVEKMMTMLKPVSFFEMNPSNDVPGSNQGHDSSTLDEFVDDSNRQHGSGCKL